MSVYQTGRATATEPDSRKTRVERARQSGRDADDTGRRGHRHVGKSTVAAGLCRLLADRGVDVAPFEAQNMSNNARAVPRAAGEGFGEIGSSQYAQARAARVHPSTDHNPVLLKPRGDAESQLVLEGEAVGHNAAGTYYDDHWERVRETARRAHE